MEIVLEIRMSHDGRRMSAWDPNSQSEVASVDFVTSGEFPDAEEQGNMFKNLAAEVASAWIEIEAAG